MLEGIIAPAILSVAGTVAVTLVSQSPDAVRRARLGEAREATGSRRGFAMDARSPSKDCYARA